MGVCYYKHATTTALVAVSLFDWFVALPAFQRAFDDLVAKSLFSRVLGRFSRLENVEHRSRSRNTHRQDLARISSLDTLGDDVEVLSGRKPPGLGE